MEVTIPGYQVVHLYRNCNGGGVPMFISVNLRYIYSYCAAYQERLLITFLLSLVMAHVKYIFHSFIGHQVLHNSF